MGGVFFSEPQLKAMEGFALELAVLKDSLVEAGVLMREREGRRNRYRIARSARLRHPVEKHCTVGSLLDLVNDSESPLRGLDACRDRSERQ